MLLRKSVWASLVTVMACMGTIAIPAMDSANWPSWRGADETGCAGEGIYPTSLEPTNALWALQLPGKGSSTPAIWRGRIFLTAPTNDLDAALAFDWNGRPLWVCTFGTQSPGAHPNGSGCNPSPATDGQGVYFRFKSGTLAGLDLNGTVLWQTNLIQSFGPENLYWDQGTSPVLTRRDVIVARMHGGDSWVSAFDKRTGRLNWKVARNYQTPIEGDHGYGTPVVIKHKEDESILVLGAQHLTDHAADDGRLLWSFGGFNLQNTPNLPTIASPVVAGDVVVVAYGRADRGQPHMYGIRLGGSGDVTPTHGLWKRDDTGTFVPTPAAYRGRIYMLRDRGEVECLDPGTGKTLMVGAFPRSSRNFYSSPLIAGDKLYAPREDGVVFVARVSNGFEVLAQSSLGERVVASPVAVSNRLFIRGDRHLFCFASPGL